MSEAITHSLKPEDLLIRTCARTGQISEAHILDTLKRASDWEYFFSRSCDERVAPLIFKTLTKIDASSRVIPEAIRNAFKEKYYIVLSKNTMLLGQLQELSEEFLAHHIPFLLFKGLALAGPVYQDLGLRESSDFDLLIHREDFFTVDAFLKESGFWPPFDTNFLRDIPHYTGYRNSVMYHSRDKNKIPLHIYWHPLNVVSYRAGLSSTIDVTTLWSYACAVSIGGATAATFSVPHQIIYLSLHGVSHGFSHISLLCDMNELILRNQGILDWDGLAKEAFNFGLSKHVYYALFLCRAILDTPVPEDVLSTLKPKKISFFEKKFISSVIQGTICPAEEVFLYFGMNESIGQRFLFLYNALFPPRKELALVRQKELKKTDSLDYIKRAWSYFFEVLRVIAKYFSITRLFSKR